MSTVPAGEAAPPADVREWYGEINGGVAPRAPYRGRPSGEEPDADEPAREG